VPALLSTRRVRILVRLPVESQWIACFSVVRRPSPLTWFDSFADYCLGLIIHRCGRSLIDAHESALHAGMIRYVSSAYLFIKLSGVAALRSGAVTTEDAGSMPDPCIILAIIFRNQEHSFPQLVQCEWSRTTIRSNYRCCPTADMCRTAQCWTLSKALEKSSVYTIT